LSKKLQRFEILNNKSSTESGVQFCGNGLVEGDEECDCGYEEDCKDKCCNPKHSGQQSSDECKLKKDSSGKQYECR